MCVVFHYCNLDGAAGHKVRYIAGVTWWKRFIGVYVDAQCLGVGFGGDPAAHWQMVMDHVDDHVCVNVLASSTHEFNFELCRLSETCGVGDHTLLWCVQDESCRSVCGRVGSILELY
jgi:hypothetical protein